ncbi:ABC transporter substrate-binding protein (plasmid) [Skermanella mucosa]|uniref:ABC transporter substrate-binding protein n=1 Tax=Skermanella mucosa TaxID=1789672 RepID=UPI00192AE836|nr:ABC transporter substrate-binding protein [Skermanella mucosa]UEM24433.1 ABC transporter substrate-binding protein [Skermanella mucosa]
MRMLKLAATTLFASLMFTAAAGAQEVVTITNIGRGYFSGPLYVAMREGLFEKHGLKPEVTFVKGGALAFQSVFTRQVDFGILSYEHVLTAAAQGRDLVSIFNITHRPLNNVIVDNEIYKANTGKSLEEKVLALKGKRVGTPSAGGSGEKMLGVLAGRYGLQLPGDVELVYLGTDAATYVGAFKNNLIDAALPFEPAGVLLEQEGLGHTLINLMDGEVEDFRDLNFMTLATHSATVEEKPELVRKVVAVFAEAQDILLDPERGQAIMGAEFSQMPPEANEKAYEVVRQIWSPDGRMSIEGGKKVFNYLQPEGGQEINYEKTFTNDFLPEE